MSNDRFYRCTECGCLEDAFIKGKLTNGKKPVCRKCCKPTKINPIIDFKKNRSLK